MQTPPRSHLAISAEALAARLLDGERDASHQFGLPAPGATRARGDPSTLTRPMVDASWVEMDDSVGDDTVILTGRDPATGKVVLKVWLLKEDVRPEWATWIRRWLMKRAGRALHLMR